MNYAVAWLPSAFQQLAALRRASGNPNAVTAAALEIDLILAAAPHTAGTPLFDSVFDLSHPPLTVEYEVSDADCRVVILAVWDTALGRPAPTGT